MTSSSLLNKSFAQEVLLLWQFCEHQLGEQLSVLPQSRPKAALAPGERGRHFLPPKQGVAGELWGVGQDLQTPQERLPDTWAMSGREWPRIASPRLQPLAITTSTCIEHGDGSPEVVGMRGGVQSRCFRALQDHQGEGT